MDKFPPRHEPYSRLETRRDSDVLLSSRSCLNSCLSCSVHSQQSANAKVSSNFKVQPV